MFKAISKPTSTLPKPYSNKPTSITTVQSAARNFDNGPATISPTGNLNSNSNALPSCEKTRLHRIGLVSRFANRIPAHQVYNELLGPDAFKDVILDIDYGALGGLNASFQSPGDFSGGQLPPGISMRPAYTTVDSLNYQQHMFNTARTINAGGNDSHAYDMSGGGQQFDVAKAIFNQADVNRDGAISRDEFRQWAQPAMQNYSNTYQSASTGGVDQGFYNAALLDGANPSVAAILQQSGIGQVIPN
jgi:EF hand